MGIILGLIVTVGCVLGGYVAGGGHLYVLWQPFELLIILGASLGTFLVANNMKTVKDTGKAMARRSRTPCRSSATISTFSAFFTR